MLLLAAGKDQYVFPATRSNTTATPAPGFQLLALLGDSLALEATQQLTIARVASKPW